MLFCGINFFKLNQELAATAMKKGFLLLIGIHLKYLLLAQSTPFIAPTPTDTLQYFFNNTTSDTARVGLLLGQPPSRYLEQADLAITLYQKGIKIATKLDDNRRLVRLHQALGYLYAYGKSDEGTAFEWYQKGLTLAESINDTEQCALFYYAMGKVYDHQGARDKMFESYKQVVAYSYKGYTPLLLRPLLSVQMAYTGIKVPEAYHLGKRTIEFVEHSAASGPEDRFLAYSTFLGTLVSTNKHNETQPYIDKTMDLLRTTALNNQPDYMYHAACTWYALKKYNLAILYAHKALNHKDSNSFVLGRKANTHQLLANIYEKIKNYPLSIAHYKAYIEAEMTNTRKMMTQESGRKVIKAEAERDLAIKQKKIEQQRLYIWAALIIAVLVVGLGSLSYVFYRREQKQKVQLAILNTTKDKLFAVLSHDLMSPVTALKNYTMLMDWGIMSQEEFVKSFKNLGRSIHSTSNMLENVLNWAVGQMGGISPNLTQVNVAEVIAEQITLVQPIATNKQITIEQLVPDDIVIKVDKNHLALIIRNLLQNALKFTPTYGLVSFSVKKAPSTKQGYLIEIKDNGIGMPPELLSQLFQIGKNINREGTSKEKGTGLGLILTKELVDANGGTIEVSSEVNKGTTFVVGFKKQTGLPQ